MNSLTTIQSNVPMRSGEHATAAMAAKAKATVEARYVIALQPHNRRQFDVVRQSILSSCKRPEFAESARYKKPVGGGTIEGFSIRFAEEAIKAMKNISVESSTIYEDDHVRTTQINVTDLENNITYGKEVTIAKTVERRKLKDGQVPLSQRQNSTGEITYLVNATEDEIANKIASAESKIIRNCGLRLVPSDILEEAEQEILKTLETGGSDPKAAIKKLTDAFAAINISASELAKYLDHALDTTSPKEIADLRAIYTTIKDGTASWSDYAGEVEKPTKPVIPKKPKEKAIDTTTVAISSATPPAPVTPAVAPVAEPPAPAPAPAPIPPSRTAFDQFIDFAETNSINFELFKLWHKNRTDEAVEWTSFADVPENLCAVWIASTVILSNIKKLCVA